MLIGGIVDISTKDIPNKSAMVIFTVGCNLGCEFCHNKHLLDLTFGQEYSINQILNKVKNNVLINSVSITGGEPTLQQDLLELCKNLRKLDKYVSLDTNGTNPSVIEKIIPYLDRVALDLKGPFNQERMKKITHRKVDLSKIRKTMDICNKAEVDFEIRTTYVGNLLNNSDIHQILGLLQKFRFKGNFVLQQYQFSEGVGDDLKGKFEKPHHATLIEILKPYQEVNLPFKIFLRDDIVGYSEYNKLIN